eukprot:3566328-Prymnesium_polylepis.1
MASLRVCHVPTVRVAAPYGSPRRHIILPIVAYGLWCAVRRCRALRGSAVEPLARDIVRGGLWPMVRRKAVSSATRLYGGRLLRGRLRSLNPSHPVSELRMQKC